MSWRISVVPSALGGKPRRLAVQPGGRVPFENFIEFAEKSTTLSSTDIKAVIEQAAGWILMCAQDGNTCDLGDLGGSTLGARGTFMQTPKKLKRKHVELSISWTLSPRIRREFQARTGDVEIERVFPKPKQPSILMVYTLVASTTWKKNVWKAGKTLHLTGKNLKFNPGRKDEGVFLIPSATGKAVKATVYQDIFPQNIKFEVPLELKGSGELNVELRRRLKPHYKLLHADTYEHPLQEVE